ncbi:SRPBCC domain-containing protein [Fulvivirga sp. M361]|uniref:SRPBCC family protein n=1 Tax=Fulvivirga sp. M361 TaxID=2594266 RepID=UPI001179D41F|nr:SRPBCC domain-containing protein [Fulvivirga sp. M361]TRX60608.1 SRPBCC domain-containing protein [Fulvivirga sp. M361]
MRKVDAAIDIHTSPERVISAFTEPGMLRDWWGVERTLIDKKVGGIYMLTWNVSDKGFGYVSTGIIKAYRSNEELIIENFAYLNPEKSILGPMSLIVKVKQKDSISEVYLCQDGYQSGGDWDWYYEAVRQAWPDMMQVLKKYLEGREPGL